MIAAVIIGITMQRTNSRILKEQIFAHLATVVQSRGHHIDDFLEEQKEKIEIAATYQELSIEELKEIERLNHGFYEVFIIDSNGIIITSSNESRIGLDRSTDDYFVNARDKTYIKDAYFSEISKRDSFAISTPHGDGVLVAKIDLHIFNDITKDKTGLGETGEVYLVNENEYAITHLLFEEEAHLKYKVDTINTKHCLGTITTEEHIEHEAISVFPDYRGINVLGAHYHLEEMNWCLLAEIDEKEALAPIMNNLWNYLILITATFVAYILSALYLSRMISKPIEELHHGIKVIEKGNLNHKLGSTAKDEIGILSRSFDAMTEKLKKSYEGLENKVKKRTEDLALTLEKIVREKEKTETIIHSIGDGIFVVDKNLNITLINQIAANMVGCEVRNCIGKKYHEVLNFVYEEDGTVNDKFIKNALATGEIQKMSNHTVLIKKDGTKIPVSDSAAPLKDKDGNVIGCVVVFMNVTKKREIERMKDEFVSIASHQLKTPLTAISWFIEVLNKGDLGKLNKKQKEYMKDVYQSNKRMIKLVNDLLNVSRLDTGMLKIEPKPMQFEKIIEDVIEGQEILIAEKQCKVTFEKPKKKLPAVLLDESLIKQVVHNLLTNAIRYSKPIKGKVLIKLELRDKNKDYLLTVSDNGIGIPKNKQQRIFEKFFRTDEAQKMESEGSGLGLYISKMIIKSSGGQIWFESEKNKGAKFYVSIPLEGMKQKKGEKILINKKVN